LGFLALLSGLRRIFSQTFPSLRPPIYLELGPQGNPLSFNFFPGAYNSLPFWEIWHGGIKQGIVWEALIFYPILKFGRPGLRRPDFPGREGFLNQDPLGAFTKGVLLPFFGVFFQPSLWKIWGFLSFFVAPSFGGGFNLPLVFCVFLGVCFCPFRVPVLFLWAHSQIFGPLFFLFWGPFLLMVFPPIWGKVFLAAQFRGAPFFPAPVYFLVRPVGGSCRAYSLVSG